MSETNDGQSPNPEKSQAWQEGYAAAVAALRSDSPAPDDLRESYERVVNSDWFKKVYHGKSITGGERETPDPYDIGYDAGFEDGVNTGRQDREGGIEVEVMETYVRDGIYERESRTYRGMENVPPGPYYLLPRPQVGDPNENGG